MKIMMKRLLSWQVALLASLFMFLLIMGALASGRIEAQPPPPSAPSHIQRFSRETLRDFGAKQRSPEIVGRPAVDAELSANAPLAELRREVKALRRDVEALKADNTKNREMIAHLTRPGATRGRTPMWITKGNFNRVDNSALMQFWVTP